MTTIHGTVLDVQSDPTSPLTVRAYLVAASNALDPPGGQVVESASTRSAVDGTWSLDLTPLSLLATPGGAYYIIQTDLDRWTITVPDSGTHELGTVLIEVDPLPATGASAAALSAEAAIRAAADVVLTAAVSAEATARSDADATLTTAVAGKVAQATWDAKGDLLGATADNTPARLAVGTAGHVLTADPAASTGLVWRAADPNAYTSGTTTMSRREVNTAAVSTTSGQMRLTYFTAPRAETITKVSIFSGGTAAGATPTLCRIGIYTVAANGDLTLIASTANDTTLLAGLSTRYERNLSASFGAVAGQRYAYGFLIVTGAATPTLCGAAPSSALNAVFSTTAPALSAVQTGLSDLPASTAVGSLTAATSNVFGELLP